MGHLLKIFFFEEYEKLHNSHVQNKENVEDNCMIYLARVG